MSYFDRPPTTPGSPLPPPAWPPGPPTVEPEPPAAPAPPAPRARSRVGLALLAGLVAGALGGAATGFVVADSRDDTPGVVTSAPSETPTTTAPTQVVTTVSELDVPGVVERALPAVVSIQVTSVGTGPFGRPITQRGSGSGFIVESDGIIYTNNHVVEGAEQVKVTLHDGRQLDGVVLGTDAGSDLAVVKVDATGLPTIPIGDSTKLRMGDPVIAIGNALALEGGPSVTTGVVSSLDRDITTNTGERLRHLLQTDAAINPGNSGGPLLNAAGEVIGINTAAAGNAENIGFAISMDHAKTLLEGLRDGTVTPRPFLGVQTTPIDEATRQQLGLDVTDGALVVAVTPGSAAENAGVRAGDVITKAGDREVRDPDDLGDALSDAKPGDRMTIEVRRGGQQLALEATLGQRAN